MSVRMTIKLFAYKMDTMLLYKHANSFKGTCTSENFSYCLFFVASCYATHNGKISYCILLYLPIFVVNVVAIAQFASEFQNSIKVAR